MHFAVHPIHELRTWQGWQGQYRYQLLVHYKYRYKLTRYTWDCRPSLFLPLSQQNLQHLVVYWSKSLQGSKTVKYELQSAGMIMQGSTCRLHCKVAHVDSIEEHYWQTIVFVMTIVLVKGSACCVEAKHGILCGRLQECRAEVMAHEARTLEQMILSWPCSIQESLTYDCTLVILQGSSSNPTPYLRRVPSSRSAFIPVV